MPTTYTTSLGLALPATGELSGTWGSTVNQYITQYLDSAVAGTQTISGSLTAVTLTVTNGSTLTQAGSGATGSAQFQIINCTGNPAGLLTITAPASSRQYIVLNSTSTNQQVKIVGAGPTTGVTLAAGEKAVVAWNGSDFVKVANLPVALGSQVTGTLPVANGGTGQTSYTDGQLLIGNTTGNTLNKATLTAGYGVTITNGGGSITISATGSGGTVTGVTASTPLASSGGTTPNISIGSSTGSGAVVLAASPSLTGTIGLETVSPQVNNASSVGYTGMPQNSQSAPYTLVAADAGKTVVHPASDNNPRTFTIPANGSVPYPVGTVVTFINMVNTVTIAITSDTMYLAGTGTTGSRTLAAYGVATAIKVGTTSWIISGNGLT
jgi:hypothetical protein